MYKIKLNERAWNFNTLVYHPKRVSQGKQALTGLLEAEKTNGIECRGLCLGVGGSCREREQQVGPSGEGWKREQQVGPWLEKGV